MADQDSRTLPIQVFLDTHQFITVQQSRRWAGNRDFFQGNDEGFARHKARMRQKVRDAVEGLRREGQAAGFLVVQMGEEALGKSYRPLNALFSARNDFGLVGGGRIGEMFFQCTPEALDRLGHTIEVHAELRPKVAENTKTGELEERVSAYRSELGGIEDIRLPGYADRVDFSPREAINWLEQPGCLGGYVVELFRPDWNVEPKAVHRMIGQFRERVAGLGGVIALPVARPKPATDRRGPLAISVHLTRDTDERMILLPWPGELPESVEQEQADSAARRLPAMRDLPIERHQQLLELLGAEPMVRRVDLPPVVEVSPFGEAAAPAEVELPSPASEGKHPVLGIVDGGVADIPAAAPWRAGSADTVAPDDRDEAHGTFIAGLVAGGRRLNPHIEPTLERDGCRFYDIALMPRDGLVSSYYVTLYEFFEQLEEQVAQAKAEAGVRVFNLSLGSPGLRRGLGYSTFAKALDEMAFQHDVIFVVSAGNLSGFDARQPWPADGERAVAVLAAGSAADERITAPAEHLLGLSVGAINPPGITGHVADVPTTYTRRGPGAGGARKPELCHYGGVSPRRGNQTGVFSLGGNGSIVNSNGTSFAAPLVAATVATIDHRLESTAPRETLMALPIHRAERCQAMQHKALRHVAREFVGFGMAPPADICLADSPYSVTLVFAETLRAKRELEFDFSWPRSLVLDSGKCRGYVDFTLAFTPPIDAEFDAESLRVQLEAYLHQIEVDPETGEDDPQPRLKHYDSALPQGLEYTERYLLQTGLKWTPVKRYSLSMPRGRGSSSNWRLALRSFTRAGAAYPEEGVPFTLIMTIADPRRITPIYDEVRNEIIRRGLELADITVAHRVRARG